MLESGEIWAKEKTYRVSPPFASDFRLLCAFVIGRMKRLGEVNPPVYECVRVVCDLFCDVLTSWLEQKIAEGNWVFSEVSGSGCVGRGCAEKPSKF